MPRLRRALPDVLAACLIALAIFLAFGHAFLNYDTFYTLLWGDELVRGEMPSYEVPVAPTPHPLATLVGAAVSPLGDSAEDALLAIVLLAMGAIGVALFRLGQTVYAWPVGLLAAAIILTRQPVLNFGIRGYVDLPTLALVLWAAVLEARRPRRGWPVLGLLAIAGLLRPEAWLFSAAYWLWIAPPLDWAARMRMAALAAVAPVLWLASDAAITGDAFYSLNGTSDLAAALDRPTGLGNVPEYLPRRLGEILRLPELVAAVAGCAAGLVWMRRRTMLPLAVAVLNGIAFVVFAIGGLSLLPRYLFIAASMLALFAALAALGWTAIRGYEPTALATPPPRLRRWWQVAGAFVIVGMLAFVPQQFDRLRDLRNDIAKRDRIQADLRDLVRSGSGEHALAACRPLYVPNHRPLPSLAYWLERPPEQIISAQLERPSPGGAFLAPANVEVERLSILDPHDPKRLDAEVPPRYRLAARNRSWLLYVGCSG